MKTAYFHFYTGNKCDEVEAFFDDKYNLVDSWSCNDATYREEYLGPGLRTLGLDIQRLPERLKNRANKAIEKFWKDR